MAKRKKTDMAKLRAGLSGVIAGVGILLISLLVFGIGTEHFAGHVPQVLLFSLSALALGWGTAVLECDAWKMLTAFAAGSLVAFLLVFKVPGAMVAELALAGGCCATVAGFCVFGAMRWVRAVFLERPFRFYLAAGVILLFEALISLVFFKSTGDLLLKVLVGGLFAGGVVAAVIRFVVPRLSEQMRESARKVEREEMKESASEPEKVPSVGKAGLKQRKEKVESKSPSGKPPVAAGPDPVKPVAGGPGPVRTSEKTPPAKIKDPAAKPVAPKEEKEVKPVSGPEPEAVLPIEKQRLFEEVESDAVLLERLIRDEVPLPGMTPPGSDRPNEAPPVKAPVEGGAPFKFDEQKAESEPAVPEKELPGETGGSAVSEYAGFKVPFGTDKTANTPAAEPGSEQQKPAEDKPAVDAMTKDAPEEKDAEDSKPKEGETDFLSAHLELMKKLHGGD